MKRVLTFLTALAFVSAMAISASAADSGKSCADAHRQCGFAQKLNLSKGQLEKMKDLRDRFRSETRDLRYDLAIKRIELRKLFTDPKTEDAALTAKQMELSSLRQQLQEKKDRMKVEWRKILTPEQIVQLGKISHRWGHKGWAMKGHCRHHGDVES